MQTQHTLEDSKRDHQKQAVLESLARGANRTSACHAAGLPRRTLYHWIEADPAFAGAVEEAEAESIGIAEDLAYACAMRAGEDPRYLRALFFWLKHRAGWVQARPDPTPALPTPAPPSSPPPAPPVEATDPATLDAAHLPPGDGAPPEENPVNSVPSVPSRSSPNPPSTRTSSFETRTSNVPSVNANSDMRPPTPDTV